MLQVHVPQTLNSWYIAKDDFAGFCKWVYFQQDNIPGTCSFSMIASIIMFGRCFCVSNVLEELE
jgi:hypothetical protein